MGIAINTLKRPTKLTSILSDRVITLMLLLLIALSLIDSHQATASIKFVGQALFQISPFFILAIFFAAFAKASSADQLIAYILAGLVAGLVGNGNPLAIPTSAIVGIPTYMNGYAAIPLISGLMELGMSPGAALSFATAGAVSMPNWLAYFINIPK